MSWPQSPNTEDSPSRKCHMNIDPILDGYGFTTTGMSEAL